MAWFFAFFFISGFCSILYELIWLRLAMAAFGVNTALVSIVLSAFMAGLGLGSWISGKLIVENPGRMRIPVLRLYAFTELLIGFSAIAAPYELLAGRTLLEKLGFSSSIGYYVASGTWIALTIVPWCALMGATIPIGMQAIRSGFPEEEHRSFSFLYVANVAGAVVGTFVPLWLIELFGFHESLKIAAVLNFSLFLASLAISTHSRFSHGQDNPSGPVSARSVFPANANTAILVLLFLTGLTSMGLEVIWIRQFTPYVGTVVYAFASILLVYLGATFIGSRSYRYWSANRELNTPLVWMLLALSALLAPVAANPDFELSNYTRILLGIAPFTGLVGFVTPMLIDKYSSGDPGKAGKAYAVNVVGCIVGPLVAGFLLLPKSSERWAVSIFAFPWFAYAMYLVLRSSNQPRSAMTSKPRLVTVAALLVAAAVLILNGRDFEQTKGFPKSYVLRDHTATIIARGEGMQKQLLVNGVGITMMTPITKMMAHLPLALLQHVPKDALVICFGMGTTYRSMMSWNISVTAVELVPSVPRMFWYYHPDGPQIMRSPLSHVVIDDGRRYLERVAQQYDVIVIDPPPPVEAAASSLLYSKEFYSVAKRRLRSDGILQQWIPDGDPVELSAVARALAESFKTVLVFHSVAGWGFHFLASEVPIQGLNSSNVVRHMPRQAVADLIEWGPETSAEAEFESVLGAAIPIQKLIALDPTAPALSDDRPVNEYYVLRRGLVPDTWKRFVWAQ
ncbi:MAG: fused MFS/spermidine synthase [Acidobacteriaceae bacterium]|nr:fused MFS/spermidine synthase [Acidobacteriaceae bacterium]